VNVFAMRECNDDLSRENAIKRAENIENLSHGMLLLGVAVSTAPTGHCPVEQIQLAGFDGERSLLPEAETVHT
jgi:branched-chain amino acid transport system substrate-binding protein